MKAAPGDLVGRGGSEARPAGRGSTATCGVCQ